MPTSLGMRRIMAAQRDVQSHLRRAQARLSAGDVDALCAAIAAAYEQTFVLRAALNGADEDDETEAALEDGDEA